MDLRWSLLGLVAFALFVKITRSKDRPASPNNKNNMDLSKPQIGASSPSPSSSSTHSLTHDVFLSFRGPDTRNNFTGHLHSNLVNKGINTFIDDGLPKGEDISQELLEVIERSKISVVVFSANYAFSKWCLNELVKIIECKESKHQIVCPIFYKVEPSEIRYQTGQVGDGIAHLSQYKENLEKVESWKAALRKFATLGGWTISNEKNEANVIDEIVREISPKIMKCIPLDVATHPVGIEFRVKDILKLLNVGQDKPRMVGIWGIGGIGKSTLAKAVYNLISHEFGHSCFLSIVSGASFSTGGLVQLQNNFLYKIIERNPPNVNDVDEGITMLKQKIGQKRVLLVLDNVNHLDQLRALAGGCDWFGPSSRIIITTRDTNLLNAHGVDFDSIYEVKELNHQEASELFNFNTFKSDVCPNDFFEVATEVIHYAKGIPLVLEVLGSDLRSKKNKDEWEDAIKYYRRYPNQQIQRALKRSYEGLEDRIKEVFLHIACFFKGDVKSYVTDVLQSCDLNPEYALKVLEEKALIKIEKNNSIWRKENSIWMHDLLEDMGKEIVRQESPDEIGQRSRLWLYEDVRKVLEANKGTDKIKGIVLRGGDCSQIIRLNSGSFTNLKNLQIFKVYYGSPYEKVDSHEEVDHEKVDSHEEVDYGSPYEEVDYMSRFVTVDCGSLSEEVDYGLVFEEGVDYLPNQLTELRVLDIVHAGGLGTITFYEGLKNMRYLKFIKLRECDGLTRIPDLSGLTSLEYLELSDCNELVEVDPSVGRLDKLVVLKLAHCCNLQKFQERINLKSLETLDLSWCHQLKFFPEIEGDMKSLNRLNLSFTDIKELPCSVGNLTGLKSLSLIMCFNLTNVPSSIFYGLQRLEDLDLQDCYGLVTFPTKSESLPPPPVFSTNPTRLQVRLDRCSWLEEISEFPREIDGLYVSGCGSLERISKLSKILEGKDSKMFGRLDLGVCKTLCDNLARRLVSGVEVDKRLFHLANKRTGELMEELTSSPFLVGTEDLEEAEEEKTEELIGEEEAEAVKLTALLTLFFSCAKSEEFQVEFPASAPLPNRFTCHCHQDVKSEEIKEHEFCIEIPQNSNWDNKGLALCISQSNFDQLTHFVYINGVKFDEKKIWGPAVWVHYIPFVTLIKRLRESGMPPPDMFRVMFHFLITSHSSLSNNISGEVSWGVHLIEN